MADDATEVTRTAKPNARGALVLVLVATVVLLPIGYVLSLGPAIWLTRRDYLDYEMAQAYWRPAEELCKRSCWLATSILWYLSLWDSLEEEPIPPEHPGWI